MKRGFILGASVALLAFGVMFFLSNRRGTPRPRAFSQPLVATPAHSAPDFSVISLDGQVVRLSDLRGQPVVVNFWATWCPPCRAEIPTFIELQKKYGSQGLRIVGISMDDSGRDAVAQFVRANGINYTVAMPNSDIVQRYGGIENLPTTFYIGRDGRVVQSVTGLVSPETIEQDVRAAFASSSSIGS